MTRDDLDKLLEQWAVQHATDAGHADALADRIADELSRDGLPNLNVTAARGARSILPRKYLYPALAASVALMILAGGLLLRSGPSRNGEGLSTGSSGEEAAALAAVASSDIEAGGRLFREMEDLFADELRWIAESGSNVRLGIHQVSGGQVAGATPLLIRVLVVQRRRGVTSWQKILENDVLTRTQERVEAVPDPKLGSRLELWAHVLPDGKVAVDSSIRLTSPIHASVDVTNVLTPGRPTRVFSLETEDGEYRIFQVVVPLPSPGDASC